MKTLTPKEVFSKDLDELVKEFESYIEVPDIKNLDTHEDRERAAELLGLYSAYISYFREMHMYAGIWKRNARADGFKSDAQYMLNLEEMLITFLKIFEQNYEYVSKLMTLKRLELDEAKIMGSQT